MPPVGPYCLVQVFGQDEPVSDESNVSRLVEKVSISNDELGKRKLQNDLELDERRQTLAETTSNALKIESE